jgi:hypothetical protein
VIASGLAGPYVIGATGGSGTRVVARIVRYGGLFIGTQLNQSEDAVEFGDFSDRWINTFIGQGNRPLAAPAPAETHMLLELHGLLERHLSTLDSSARAWGWKEPRSIFLLRFFARQLPQLKFLHVVRDGRDMAFSTNQNQLLKHGAALLGDTECESSPPVRSMALWSRLNMLAADFGEQQLGARYMRIRFEDLCAQPVPTIGRVFDFFSLAGDVEHIAQLELRPPDSLARWRTQPEDVLRELHRVGGLALRRFGYLDVPLSTDGSGAGRGSVWRSSARRVAALLRTKTGFRPRP